MKTFLYFCVIFIMIYTAAAQTDVPRGFLYLGRSGSKTYFWSTYLQTFKNARSACKSHSMLLARLESRTEHDDLYSMFFNRVLEGYVYVGITLLGSNPIDEETRRYIPYKVVYYPGQPSGSGRCFEIKRYKGGNGLNNILCTAPKRFICERKDTTTTSTASIPTTTTTPIPITTTTPIPTTTNISTPTTNTTPIPTTTTTPIPTTTITPFPTITTTATTAIITTPTPAITTTPIPTTSTTVQNEPDVFIDCKGRDFHCVDSRQFLHCFEINGQWRTISNTPVACPAGTFCDNTKKLECGSKVDPRITQQ